MRAIRTATVLWTVLGLMGACLLVASCGRPGLPRLPQGQSDSYPAGYPEGAKAPAGTILKNPDPQDAR